MILYCFWKIFTPKNNKLDNGKFQPFESMYLLLNMVIFHVMEIVKRFRDFTVSLWKCEEILSQKTERFGSLTPLKRWNFGGTPERQRRLGRKSSQNPKKYSRSWFLWMDTISYGWWKKSGKPVDRYVLPFFIKVLYIPGGAGFLPSTVSYRKQHINRPQVKYAKKICANSYLDHPLDFYCHSCLSFPVNLKLEQHYLVGGFNPFEKCWSNWIISPGRGKNKTCLKPPPSIFWQSN